jgi:hypothetical protein
MPKAKIALGCFILLSFYWGAAAEDPAATAADPCRQPCPCECRPLTCCPDDYCRKCIPQFPCLPCFQCDDYCRKPLPAIPCFDNCGQCDDYCRKPAPCACRPLNFELFKCVPTNPSCSPCAPPSTHQAPAILNAKTPSDRTNPNLIR